MHFYHTLSAIHASLRLPMTYVQAHPKRGRPCTPDSANQMIRRARNRSAAARKRQKLTLAACAKSVCLHDHHDYPASTIHLLRLYLHRLPLADQRRFIDARMFDDIEKIAELSNLKNKKTRSYHLETPNVLLRRLETAMCNGSALPCPREDDLQPVCIKFFAHACDRSTNFLYQYRPNEVHYPTITAEEHAFALDPVRQIVERESPKKTSVLAWFDMEVKISCALPTDPKIVLAYSTKKQAHASYVLQQETARSFAHAEKSVARFMATLNSADYDDVVVNHEEACDGLDAPLPARVLPKKKPLSAYRYSNMLLGEKSDDFPELEDVASYTWFVNIWQNKEEYPHLQNILVRKWMMFAKCDTCCKYRENSAKSIDSKERVALSKVYQKHVAFIKRERRAYETKRMKAINNPREYLSLIIDGADAARFALPHFAHASSTTSKKWHLRLHILGCIAHGRRPYVFTCPSHYAQGHNITIQVIKDVILDTQRREGTLPPKLFLQLDNTTKQNKGKYLFGFLAHLMYSGVFKSVEVSFLPVGHTHEDIDQMFSRMSVYLRSHNAPCRRSMGICIERAYTKNGQSPVVVHWDNVANISGFLGPHVRKIPDVTSYYHFHLARAAGNISMQVRTWPGALPDDPVDFWRGPGEYHSPNHLVFEQHSNVPSLLVAKQNSEVPPAARATHCLQEGYFHNLDKRKEDLYAMFDLFPNICNQSAIDDCLLLLEMESTPLDTAIPFAWTDSEITQLYSHGGNPPVNELALADLEADQEEIQPDVPDRYINTFSPFSLFLVIHIGPFFM